MNSIFLRLYFLIVLTVVVVGFTLDFFWRSFEQPLSENTEYENVTQLAATHLNSLPQTAHKNKLSELNKVVDGRFTLLSKEDELVKSLRKRLAEVPFLITQNKEEVISFKLLDDSESILQYRRQTAISSNYLKYTFILIFYGTIAVVIFFWFWPLSKDLNRLEKAVSQFDQQRWQSKVELPTTSSVAHLAKAYNALLNRIRLLVETQQAMSHSISHELRTPLARVRFSLQMAEESTCIKYIQNQLNSVAEDVEEMNRLINELLNFAALEKISVVAKLERGNINLLIENLIERLQRNSLNKKIRFVAVDEGSNVLCDNYLIERAIQNLIVNACKFSNNEVVINFCKKQTSYEITVEDDGPGVDDNMRSAIFDSFVQLDAETKKHGFGLGLAIVKRVMELHKGQSIVKNSKLGGAKFILSWPRYTQ